jgi:hypothetical protein
MSASRGTFCHAPPRARRELEARLQAWRDAAKVIGELDIGLDDA